MLYKLHNHTNRTVEFPLPGGGWCRLLPGQHRELNDKEAVSPHVDRLSRRAGIQLSKQSAPAVHKKKAITAEAEENKAAKVDGENPVDKDAKKIAKVETGKAAKENDRVKKGKETSTAKKEE